MTKQTVHYIPHVLDDIRKGRSALVMKVLDHPSDLVSNTKAIHTSDVVEINDYGFETQNTIYKANYEPI